MTEVHKITLDNQLWFKHTRTRVQVGQLWNLDVSLGFFDFGGFVSGCVFRKKRSCTCKKMNPVLGRARKMVGITAFNKTRLKLNSLLTNKVDMNE